MAVVIRSKSFFIEGFAATVGKRKQLTLVSIVSSLLLGLVLTLLGGMDCRQDQNIKVFFHFNLTSETNLKSC